MGYRRKLHEMGEIIDIIIFLIIKFGFHVACFIQIIV